MLQSIDHQTGNTNLFINFSRKGTCLHVRAVDGIGLLERRQKENDAPHVRRITIEAFRACPEPAK